MHKAEYYKRREEFNTKAAYMVVRALQARGMTSIEYQETTGQDLDVITDEYASIEELMKLLVPLGLTLSVVPIEENMDAFAKMAELAREKWFKD